MWHQQRKEEKRLKGLMVDKRRRAERRRDYYEKIKMDPNQFLQVHGRPMKIHLDPSIALAADSPANMMPWNGDKRILIDRFDVRANLDYIPEYKSAADTSEELDYKEAKEMRQINYERYRILIQNEYMELPEEKFLRTIDLEEKYGGKTYQTQKAKEDKKKSVNKAAIGFVYDAPPPPPEPEPESDSESDADSDIDFDLNVDVMSLGTEEQQQLNEIGLLYELGRKDFVRMLARDVEEAEELRMEKEKEAEKSALSGKKSRRQRKLLKEQRLEGRGRISYPSFAARSSRSRSRSRRSESESESETDSGEEKVEFITSFGGDSDHEAANGSSKKKKRKKAKKAYRDPIGPDLPRRRRSRSRSRDRHRHKRRRDRSGEDDDRPRSRSPPFDGHDGRPRHRRHRRRHEDEDDENHYDRRRQRHRSRSGSKASSRSSLLGGDDNNVKDDKDKDDGDTRKEQPHQDAKKEEEGARGPRMGVYIPASNHNPNMLAYPPPPKPEDFISPLEMAEVEEEAEKQMMRQKLATVAVPPPPGFIPPLPRVPHPDDLPRNVKENPDSPDSSDSSGDEKNKSGYRSKYRDKKASSEEETAAAKQEEPTTLYQHSMSSFFNAVSENIQAEGKEFVNPELILAPEPPPLRRYYGRKRNDSDSDISGDSDEEAKKQISQKIKERVEQKSSVFTATKGASAELLAQKERLKKKMQQQIRRTYKEDKLAEQERLRKQEEEQLYREEELRELAEKKKVRERERRQAERGGRSSSRSRSRSTSRSRWSRRQRSRSRTRDDERRLRRDLEDEKGARNSYEGEQRRSRSRERRRSGDRKRSRNDRSRDRVGPKLVDY